MHKKWFTLIEMLIVIVIISILWVALIPRVVGVQARARDVARDADTRNLATSLEIYLLDHNQYPWVGELWFNDIQLYASVGPLFLAQAWGEKQTRRDILIQLNNDLKDILNTNKNIPQKEMSFYQDIVSQVELILKDSKTEEEVIEGYISMVQQAIKDINSNYPYKKDDEGEQWPKEGQEEGIPVRKAQAVAIRNDLKQNRNPTMSTITSFGDARLQTALLPYLTTIPKDTNRWLSTEIGSNIGECKQGGDYFAYYADDNMMIITSIKESQKGNTNDCIGSDASEWSYAALTTYTTKWLNTYPSEIKDLSYMKTEEIYKSMNELIIQLGRIIDDKNSLNEKLLSAEASLADLENMLQQYQSIDPKQTNEEISRTKEELQTVNESISKEEDNNIIIKGMCTDLQIQIDDMVNKGAKEDDIQPLRDELIKCQKELDGSNKYVTELYIQSSQLTTYLEILESWSTVLIQQIADTKNGIDSTNEKIKALESNYLKIEDQYAAYVEELQRRGEKIPPYTVGWWGK